MTASLSEDWIALLELVARYSRALDTKDYDLLRTCFAEPMIASYDCSNVGVPTEQLTYRSADEMVENASRIHRPLAVIMHRNSNQRFEIDGDRATGRVYVDVFQVRTVDRDPPETTHHLGWYDDAYVRRDGRWLIARRHFTALWTEGTWIGGSAT